MDSVNPATVTTTFPDVVSAHWFPQRVESQRKQKEKIIISVAKRSRSDMTESRSPGPPPTRLRQGVGLCTVKTQPAKHANSMT